jgi:hypothetical protein
MPLFRSQTLTVALLLYSADMKIADSGIAFINY